MNWICTSLFAFVTLITLSLVSCDKAKDLYQTATDKVKALKEDQSEGSGEALVKTVAEVSEVEGNEIISNEARLVMVEFYSDT